MFGTFMIIIFVGYAGWYTYNIIKDLYFDKSAVVAEDAVEEKEVDIGEELKDFTQYDANEEDKLAYARKQAEAEAAKKNAEEAIRQFSERKDAKESSSSDDGNDNTGGAFAFDNAEQLDIPTMSGAIEVDKLADSLSEWESKDEEEFDQLMASPYFAKKI